MIHIKTRGESPLFFWPVGPVWPPKFYYIIFSAKSQEKNQKYLYELFFLKCLTNAHPCDILYSQRGSKPPKERNYDYVYYY
jgi:hypothetical protein